jgi:hypothetical protein
MPVNPVHNTLPKLSSSHVQLRFDGLPGSGELRHTAKLLHAAKLLDTATPLHAARLLCAAKLLRNAKVLQNATPPLM